MRMIHKVYLWLSTIIVIMGMILIWYVTYLYVFDANPPVKFNEEVMPVVEHTVERGWVVTINPSGCRYTNVPVLIYYSVVDWMEYNMPRQTFVGTALKDQCFSWDTTQKTYRIPWNIPPWRYFLRIKLEYRVNRLVTRYVNITSEWFNIK
jgi:hypothetical protein